MENKNNFIKKDKQKNEEIRLNNPYTHMEQYVKSRSPQTQAREEEEIHPKDKQKITIAYYLSLGAVIVCSVVFLLAYARLLDKTHDFKHSITFIAEIGAVALAVVLYVYAKNNWWHLKLSSILCLGGLALSLLILIIITVFIPLSFIHSIPVAAAVFFIVKFLMHADIHIKSKVIISVLSMVMMFWCISIGAQNFMSPQNLFFLFT